MSDKPDNPDRAPTVPLTPADFLLARFENWIERWETLKAREGQKPRQAGVSDDIPSFITRES